MKKEENKLLRINENPYFLLNNYTVRADIDLNENILDTEHKKNVSFGKAHKIEIFFIKFFPYLFLLFLMYRFPQNKIEILISVLSIVCIYIFKIINHYFSDFFLKVFYTLFAFLLIFLVLKIDGSFKYINFFIISLISNFILVLFVDEYIKFGISNYYKLLNVRKKGELKLTAKKTINMLKLPFSKKHLIKKEMGFDSSIKYNLEGFYFKILDEGKTND